MLLKTKPAKRFCYYFAGLLFCLLGNNLNLLADESTWNSLKLSTGVDYSSGDYGSSDDTDIWYVPNTLKYEYDNWTAKLTIPYIRITGPGNVVGSGPDGPVVVERDDDDDDSDSDDDMDTGTDGTDIDADADAASRTTESGLGDVFLSLSYLFNWDISYLPGIELTGKVKFPTANENKGLGTGEYDYTAQLDVFKAIANFTPFASVGYRFAGEPSGEIDLNNTLFASLGLGYKFNAHWNGGLIFDYREPTSNAADDSKELVPYLTWKSAKSIGINLYGVVGFSDGSPDMGAGLQFSYQHDF